MSCELYNALESAGSYLESAELELAEADREAGPGQDRQAIRCMAEHVRCLLNAIGDRLARAKAEELASV